MSGPPPASASISSDQLIAWKGARSAQPTPAEVRSRLRDTMRSVSWLLPREDANQRPGRPYKSRAGRRRIGLPPDLVPLLEAHREAQEKERVAAAQLWVEDDWVFASPLGHPLNPNTDYHEWKDLLKAAGLRDGRLHDARHTAATVLLVLGVQQRAVMGVMGWSSPGMATRYQHVTDPIRQDIARRVGDIIWNTTTE